MNTEQSAQTQQEANVGSQETVSALDQQLPNQVTPQNNLNNRKKGSKKFFYLAIGVVLLVLTGLGYLFFGQDLFGNKFGSKNEASERSVGTQETKLAEEQATANDEQKLKVQVQDVSSTQNDLPELDKSAQKQVIKDTVINIVSTQDIYQTGDQVTAKVQLSTSEQPDGVQFVINYDPQLLTGVTTTAINDFGYLINNSVDQETGRIKLVLLRNQGEEIAPAADMGIIEITGTTAQAGELNFSFDQEKTKVAAGGGQSILDKASGLTLTLQ